MPLYSVLDAEVQFPPLTKYAYIWPLLFSFRWGGPVSSPNKLCLYNTRAGHQNCSKTRTSRQTPGGIPPRGGVWGGAGVPFTIRGCGLLEQLSSQHCVMSEVSLHTKNCAGSGHHLHLPEDLPVCVKVLFGTFVQIFFQGVVGLLAQFGRCSKCVTDLRASGLHN